MKINLIHAESALKKVAYSEGIRTNVKNAWYAPISREEVKAIIGDDSEKEIEVTVFDLEYATGVTWDEVKAGRL